jgi:uracil-DNA glycosylase
VVVALGRIAFDRCRRVYARRGWALSPPKASFAHGLQLTPSHGPTLIASFHPSQQNTFTGRLTAEMLAVLFRRARALIAEPRDGRGRRSSRVSDSPTTVPPVG